MRKPKSIAPLAKALVSSDKRQSIRFEPDPGTIALIDVSGAAKKRPFEPTHTTLITEESHRGCGIVMKMTQELQVGAHCRVKVGPGEPLTAEVRWRIELDSQIVRIGLMYLE